MDSFPSLNPIHLACKADYNRYLAYDIPHESVKQNLLKNIWSTINSKVTIAEDQFDFSRRFLVGILLLPIAILVFQLLLTFPIFSEYKPIFWGENKPIENIQFIFFLLGVILSLRMAWFTKAQKEEPFVWAFYLLISLGLFFIAMEEIAWGQQFLQFKTPESIRAFNAQNEFTLHNVEILQDRTDILNLIFGFAGLIGLWVGKQKKIQKAGIPGFLSPWFVLIFIMSSFGVFNDFFSINPQFDYSIHKQTETTELLIAVGTFLYLFFNLRIYTYGHSRWHSIKKVNITEQHLIITGSGERKISLPIEQFPWLAAAPKEKRGRWQIANSEECVQWPELENSICLDQLLDNPITEEEKNALTKQSLSKTYFYSAAIASAISTIWLALIPVDPKNALIFGYSGTRFAMMAAGAGLVILFLRGLQKSSREPGWYAKLSSGLQSFVVSNKRKWFSLILALLGLIGSTVFLGITFTEKDPYTFGFLARMAPWAFFGLAISGLLLYYVLQKSMLFTRMKLAHATNMVVEKEQITFVLKDQRSLSLPIASFPFLDRSSVKERKDYEIVAEGLRIHWPKLEEDLCVQQLLAGIPPSYLTA